MKVFKSNQYPTEREFLALADSYSEYLDKMSRNVTPRPRQWPSPVMEYVCEKRRVELDNQEPLVLEWTDMTEEEWRDQEREKEEEEEKKRLEEEKKTRRQTELEEARSDPVKRDEFISREMEKRGFTTDKLILALIRKDWDEKDISDFRRKRKEALAAIRKEIDGG